MLSTHHKISRVLAGKPFGNGVLGDYSSGSLPSLTYRNGYGTASSTSFTLTAGGFANGDIIFIHQSRGPTVYGRWEINQIVSGGGTTNLTLKKPLAYTFSHNSPSTAYKCQIIKIQMYKNFTITGGNPQVPSWNQDYQGIFIAAVSKTLTLSASGGISGGYNGYEGGPAGTGSTGTCSGEGTDGAKRAWPDGGIQGNGGSQGYGGGGGGHLNAGNPGTGSYNPGPGGYARGNNDLTELVFGGGGGSGASANEYNGAGGRGGGIVFFIAKNIDFSSAIGIHTYGVSGENSGNGSGGGGGAGGAILCQGYTVNIGTNKIAVGGAAGGSAPNNNYGGYGSNGRIAIHYGKSFTGSTSYTYSTFLDPTLKESPGGGFYKHLV